MSDFFFFFFLPFINNYCLKKKNAPKHIVLSNRKDLKKKPFAKENHWKRGMSLVSSSKAFWALPGELAILLPPWRITEES